MTEQERLEVQRALERVRIATRNVKIAMIMVVVAIIVVAGFIVAEVLWWPR